MQRITTRMVLSPTTGFPNWRPGRWSGSSKPLTIQFEPGTNFRYSAEGYNYLQMVVENITGQQLDIYMKDASTTDRIRKSISMVFGLGIKGTWERVVFLAVGR